MPIHNGTRIDGALIINIMSSTLHDDEHACNILFLKKVESEIYVYKKKYV